MLIFVSILVAFYGWLPRNCLFALSVDVDILFCSERVAFGPAKCFLNVFSDSLTMGFFGGGYGLKYPTPLNELVPVRKA